MINILGFLGVVSWTIILVVFVVVFLIVFSIGYIVGAIASFVQWLYALYCYVWDYSHGNYDQL